MTERPTMIECPTMIDWSPPSHHATMLEWSLRSDSRGVSRP